jgi:YCII-related domain-containing protein
MADFILLMHGDAVGETNTADWGAYIAGLQAQGAMQGGSAIGGGATYRKAGDPAALNPHIVGYLKVTAPDLAAAAALLSGNPVYEAGGTVEVRELPLTG